MSEIGTSPEVRLFDKQRVVMVGDDPEKGRLGVLFAASGRMINLANEGSGLNAQIDSGRTLIATENGRFLIVRSHILHVDNSVRRGELLVTPISTLLRQNLTVTVGRGRDLGSFH